MRVETLINDRIADFVAYCIKHRREVDESYLSDEDLRDFQPNDENPTYIAINEKGEIIAAASLVINDYLRSGRKARFRIFHSEVDNLRIMNELMQAILKHVNGLNHIFLFVQMTNKKQHSEMEALKFKIDRYAFFLVREDLPIPEINLPEDYKIRPFMPGKDEENWCKVRNISFATLRGSETPMSPDLIAKMLTDEDYIEGGMMLLYHQGKPVGVVRAAKDEYEGTPIINIGPLAIIPEYQGKGLGRSLLRVALQFAKEKGYKMTALSVNAENERAKALYLQEGFKEAEAVVCFRYDLV